MGISKCSSGGDGNEDYYEKGTSKKPNEGFISGRLADWFRDSYFFCAYENRWYKLRGNVWHPLKRYEFLDAVRNRAESEFNILFGVTLLGNVVKGLESRLRWTDEDRIVDFDDFVMFQNGMLHKESLNFQPLDPRFKVKATRVLPTAFDSNEVKEGFHPLFKLYMSTVCGHDWDKLNILRGFFRRFLLQEPQYQTALFLNGPPNSWKSMLMRLVRFMLGTECVSITLKQLLNPFERGRIKDAKVVVVTEVESFINDEGLSAIKSLTGRDALPYQVKNVQSGTDDGGDSFVFEGVLVFFSNKEMHDIFPLDEALYSRFLEVTFSVSADVRKALPETLLPNLLPHFVYWGLTAPDEIMVDHVRSDSRGRLALRALRDNHYLIDFITSRFTFKYRDRHVPVLAVQRAISEYRKENGLRVSDCDISRLQSVSKSIFGADLEYKRISVNKKRFMAWIGMSFLNQDSLADETPVPVQEDVEKLDMDPFAIQKSYEDTEIDSVNRLGFEDTIRMLCPDVV
jgi:phage/plasmid-associated DNA primase